MITKGTLIGRYLVREKLAEGGMAEVYLASALGSLGFTKDVVLKVVLPALAQDDEFNDMFVSEARIASKLAHPNIVQIFDFGKHEDRYFIAMEYVSGVSVWRLRSRCRKLGIAFPPLLAAAICRDVASALDHAHALSEGGHSLQVVHRDVSPHNVLLSVAGAVKLTDFGIAKASTSNTRPGILKGKFPYMSPEQARGEQVDRRTDVFALGILLWELLTGKRLFVGTTDVEVLRAVQSGPIVSPVTYGPHVPEELAAVALRALARPVSERYQTAAEVERDLVTFLLRHSKGVDDTSVSRFLREMFPPEENFQSPIETSAPETGAPKEPEAPPVPVPIAVTEPLPGLPPAPRRERGPGPGPTSEPSSRPTMPLVGLIDVGTDRVPHPRAAGGSPKGGRAPPFGGAPPTLRGDNYPWADVGRAVPDSPRTLTANTFPSAHDEALLDGGGVAECQAARETSEVSFAPAMPNDPRGRGRVAMWSLLALGCVCAVSVSIWWAAPKPPPASAVAQALADPPGASPTPNEGEEKTSPAASVTSPSGLPAGGEVAQDAPVGTPDAVDLTRSLSPEAAPQSTGRLTVHAIPFALVTVRGKAYGKVFGTRSYRLAPGTYDVQLTHPGGRVAKSVLIRAGDEAQVELNVLR